MTIDFSNALNRRFARFDRRGHDDAAAVQVALQVYRELVSHGGPLLRVGDQLVEVSTFA